MAKEKKIRELIIEPEDFSVRGMNLEEILAEDFWNEVKKQIPTAEFDHIVLKVGEDSRIVLGYETKKGKIIRDRFLISTSPPELAKQIIEILKRH